MNTTTSVTHGTFEDDLARVLEIRQVHDVSAPFPTKIGVANHAWHYNRARQHRGDLLAFIDKLWAEYSKTLQQLDDCTARAPVVSSADIAAALAHRGCCGSEHDPSQGKLRGYCVVCGVPWPCETAEHFLRRPSPTQKQWRCFHCDDVFTNWIEARNHFGYTPEDGAPSCKTTRGDDSELYHLKRRLELYQREDTDLHRKLSAKEAEMATAVREAEEKGYARGLEDAKKHPETLGLQPVIHNARYDVTGWICSICHGWNEARSQQCVHAHSGSISLAPDSGSQPAKEQASIPTLHAYNEAMQAAGVPHEPLEVYTSNSWVRVGIAKKYREVMTPDTRLDTRSASVLEALVAAFNAMLDLRKEPKP